MAVWFKTHLDDWLVKINFFFYVLLPVFDYKGVSAWIVWTLLYLQTDDNTQVNVLHSQYQCACVCVWETWKCWSASDSPICCRSSPLAWPTLPAACRRFWRGWKHIHMVMSTNGHYRNYYYWNIYYIIAKLKCFFTLCWHLEATYGTVTHINHSSFILQNCLITPMFWA